MGVRVDDSHSAAAMHVDTGALLLYRRLPLFGTPHLREEWE